MFPVSSGRSVIESLDYSRAGYLVGIKSEEPVNL